MLCTKGKPARKGMHFYHIFHVGMSSSFLASNDVCARARPVFGLLYIQFAVRRPRFPSLGALTHFEGLPLE